MISVMTDRHGNRRGRYFSALFSLLFVALLTVGSRADDRTLIIGGTGGALGTMTKLAEAFKQSNPAISIRILPSLGSSGGARALAAGRIDIALTARHLKEDEQDDALEIILYAKTAVVLATPVSNPVSSITVRDLVKIVSGEKSLWPDGTPVGLVIRQEHDSETLSLESMSPLMPAALDKARNRPGVPVGLSVQNAADLIQNHKGGLGTTSMATIMSENRPLKSLSLDGIEPTEDTVRSGKYKYTESFFMVYNKQSHNGVKDFVDFVRSPKGLEILQKTGHVAIKN